MHETKKRHSTLNSKREKTKVLIVQSILQSPEYCINYTWSYEWSSITLSAAEFLVICGPDYMDKLCSSFVESSNFNT